MSEITITNVRIIDLRFPTSREQIGSDAVNKDPDYSAAYCILETNQPGLTGHGLTFTLGRGTELCVGALSYLAQFARGRRLDELTSDLRAFSRQLTGETQFRWLGPEKGVIHLACSALLNAVWDLYAKAEGKPLWRLLAEMEPARLAALIDYRYIADVLTENEAVEMLCKQRPRWQQRLALLELDGYAAYTTSVGWYGFSDEKIRRLCREAIAAGWTHFKLKVGGDSENDLRRGLIVREEIGEKNKLMVDANQRWGVPEAIEKTKALAELNPWWMEEPTSPDDILGHARIRREVAPIRIATGEHVHNAVMFKQLFQAGAIDVCQIDSCRVASVNENLAIMLMAAKFGIPVCPHAGGVGLCEYVQHLAIFDYLCISATMENRVIEYVDHLHQHFVTPVVIRRGHYMVPQAAGYSIEIKPESLKEFSFPDGPAWKREKQ
ncbi:MAG: enolase C-terminal domain-like protein [Terracidiphilus sp.]|jgi:L-fuconate dehydratase